MSGVQTTQTEKVWAIEEWPTWLLIVVVYTGWWICLSYYDQVGPLMGLALILVCALHNSVQHELLHGHPTSSLVLNGLLAYPPLALLFPYSYYRESHMAHHNKHIITLPGLDPESYYVLQSDWEKSRPVYHAYFTFYKTLSGRLICGPAHSLVLLCRDMAQDFYDVNLKKIRMWLSHIALVSVILGLVSIYFQIPLWHYAIIAYCANSLLLVRSFFEHRVADNGDHRSVIVETGLFFRLLFLNNNYHYLHHKFPDAPWYHLSHMYERDRDAVLQENDGFLVKGYRTWFMNYFLTPVDSPVHPFPEVEKTHSR